jgi:hypothetical protein
VQLTTVRDLASYWATEYDWRRCEAKLNALPQFVTEIDGLGIHFIHEAEQVNIQALGLSLRRVVAGYVSAAGAVLVSWLCVV